ncbi:amidase [Opitutaceae bacterium]
MNPFAFPFLLPRVLLYLGIAVFSSATRAEVVTFDLTSASISDVNAAFDAGALTSEQLTQLYLNRIYAYERSGPKLHAIITLNPDALNQARMLDEERRTKGPRGPLHGIPVLLKDNIDTVDLPTSGGFYGLRDSIPAQDAEQTRRLREAGCVILGKTNLSEFASGAAISTLGGQILNPHAIDRSPSGSSGGSAVSVAAGFAMFALGTDTGGSIRGPSAATGIVGLKPTLGLNGRGGIIPLALSLDTVGPMARHVADVAVALNVMAGPDPRDPATQEGAGMRAADYTAGLKSDALKGVRLGLLRDWMKFDPGVDAVIETAVAVLRNQGAEVVDVEIPRYVLGLSSGLYEMIRDTEFRYQVEEYLATLPRKDTPKTLSEIVKLTEKITAPTPEGWVPNANRLATLRKQEKAGTLQDTPYATAVTDGRKIVRDNLTWIMQKEKLDAFIVPTNSRPVPLIKGEQMPMPSRAPTVTGSVAQVSNLTGWPDLIVPAGFTSDPLLPVTLSFVGPAFSEARLLAYGYAFERALPVRRLPAQTPPLPGEKFDYEPVAKK